MKIFFLIITFLSFNDFLLAQNFSLNELIRLNTYSLDNFDTQVTKRGYQYFDTENSSLATSTIYTYKVNGLKTYYITKFFYKKNNSEMISFQTPKNTTYLKIKSELKTLGFIYAGAHTFQGSTFFNYKKGDIEVSLVSGTQKSELGGPTQTVYEISVKKIAK